MAFCAACGRENKHDARFCDGCGGPIAAPATVTPAVLIPPAPPTGPGIGSVFRGAWERFRGIPFVAQVCAVLVLLLVAGWYFFLRPMDASEYTAKARAYVETIDEAIADSEVVWEEFAVAQGNGQPLDDADIRDLKDGLAANANLIRKAADGIRWLRPPAEYETTQKRIETYVNMLTADWLPAEERSVNAMTPGMDYGEAMYSRSLESNRLLSGSSYADALNAWQNAKDRLDVYSEEGD